MSTRSSSGWNGRRGAEARWFKGVVERGDIWVAWTASRRRVRRRNRALRNNVEKVEGGYMLMATRSSQPARAARSGRFSVNTAGPGGVRHATAESLDTQLLMACDLSDPTVRLTVHGGTPSGCARPSAIWSTSNTFIPDANLIGYPGQYIKEDGRLASSHTMPPPFWALPKPLTSMLLIRHHAEKVYDPYVQHHIGQMSG